MIKNVIDEIVNAIANKIVDVYGGREKCYPIYDSSLQQGEQRPCFFIKYLKGDEKREIGLQNRFYKDLINFVIVGYTEDGNMSVIYEMINNLNELEYITLSDKTILRADKLHPEVDDGVLQFFIDYKIFIKKEDNELTKMDNYKFDGEVKKDEK